MFQINYGSDASVGSLSERFVVGKANLPATRTPFGAEIGLFTGSPEVLNVRVMKTIPAQMFGVVKTTTYRIY